MEFIKESLVFTGEDSPRGQPHALGQGAFAEFERSLIRERQREGIALEKQRDAYKRRKKTLTQDRAAELFQRAGSGVSEGLLARDCAISRETVTSTPARPSWNELLRYQGHRCAMSYAATADGRSNYRRLGRSSF